MLLLSIFSGLLVTLGMLLKLVTQHKVPGEKLVTLSLGRTHRLVAFDTGARRPGTVLPLSYP